MPKYHVTDDAAPGETFVAWGDDLEDAQHAYISAREDKGEPTGNLRLRRAPEPQSEPRHFGHWIGGPL